ncbi:MAG TPA: lipoprotein signal peptidase [Cytophagaceae bacterium]
MKYTKYYLLSLGVIILDQIVKLVVYNTMNLHQEIPVLGDWFKLHYTTNPGMAFGLEIGGVYGKLFLTSFRLLAMVGIAYYLYHLAKKGAKPGLLWCIALILAGAIGNLVDSIFYGVTLGLEAPNAPTPWFHGQVIDMFYFDIWEGFLPHWIPIIGGQYYSLWPIFNIADASIFIGVAIILIMQKRYFSEGKPAQNNNTNQEKLTE